MKLSDFIPSEIRSLFASAPTRTPKTAISDTYRPGMRADQDDTIIESKGIEGYRKMRRDAEVAADTDLRLAAMIPGLQVLPADTDEDAKAAAEFCESILTAMDGELECTVRDRMLDEAVTTGFFVGEPEQAVMDLPKFGKVLGLRSILVRPSEGFSGNIKLNQFGRVESLEQWTMGGIVEVNPADVLYYAFRGQPWNPYGRSIYHAAWDFWKLKQALTRYFADFSTVNASGIKEYVIKDEDFDRDSAAALERLQAMAGRASIVRKKSHELELHIPPGHAGYHFIRGIRELCNVEIRKAILYDETVNAEGMRTGSRSSREVSENIMYSTMRAQGRAFCTSIAEQLLRRILDWNGYERWPTPRLVPEATPIRDADPAPILTALTGAYTAGVISTIPAELEEQILRQTLRPMGVDYVKDAADVAEKTEATLKMAASLPGRTHRDLMQMKKEAVEAEKAAVATITDTWQTILPELKQHLNRTLFDRAGHWKTKDFAALRKAAEEVTKGGSKIRDALTDALMSRYEAGRDSAEKTIKVHAAVQVTPVAIDPVQARKMLAQRVYLTMGRTYGDLTDSIYYILENAISGGISEREAMVQVSRELERQGFTAGRSVTIVKTSLAAAFNEGRMAMFAELHDPGGTMPGGIVGYQYSAIMDDFTTELCQQYDGLTFAVDDPALPEPPLHHNCRSTLLPIFTGEGHPDFTDPAVSKSMSANIPEGFGGN